MNDILPVANTNVVRYADFFKLTMPTGTYYFSTAPSDIFVSGIGTFTGLGQLVQVGSAQRDIKSTANETTITLVGIDTANLGIVLSSKIKGSQIQLWHGFFNENNQLLTLSYGNWVNNSSLIVPWRNVLDANIPWILSTGGNGLYQYFNGYVNSFSISEQWMEEARAYTGAVTLSASSFQLILQNRTAGRYTNDNSWQSVNPGDTSMNRVNFISTINYAFGRDAT
jgi:hypothetical protein